MDRRNKLVGFIQDELVVTQDTTVGYDDDLLLSGLVNSLGVMRLVAFVESEFNITVPAEDITIEHFETVSAINSYLQTLSPEA